jgi:hypothetical protein
MTIALQEGTFTFHTVQHHQSVKSMDCSSGLIKKFTEPKFTCSRTKVEAIIKHVISPWAYEEVTEEIKTTSFVTVLIDESNHGHVKLLPILIRYVLVDIDADKTENDSCVQIKTKVTDFVEITGETAEILSRSALQAIRKISLENKLIANQETNTNFGGLKRKGTNKVFCKIKEDLNRGVIGLVCSTYDSQLCTFFY